jgi:hypothetical protein
MFELDDQLQNSLALMENGHSLEEKLNDMDNTSGDLAPMIQLADLVRSLQHPSPSKESLKACEKSVMEAARKQAEQVRSRQLNLGNNHWVVVPAMAGVALVLLCMAVSVLGAAFWLSGPRSAHAVTLTELVGQVEVTAKDGTWQPASEGDLARTGQRLRTQQESSVTIMFFDGSRTSLASNTEITFTRLDGSWGDVLRAELTQPYGTTTNSVVNLRSGNDRFTINTPSGTASVMGTVFNVSVDDQGHTFYAVERGKVQVGNSVREVDLAAGQGTYTRIEQAPEEPSYLFGLCERLTLTEGDTWVVSNVPFQVSDETYMTADVVPGDLVRVAGRISDGVWIADLIEPLKNGEFKFYFTGIISSMDSEAWIINGVTVLINEVTELEGEFSIGDAIKVKYIVLDGDRWLALEIEHLDDDDDDQTPTPTGTVTGTITPVITVTGTPPLPPVDCTGADPHPTGQKLSQRYGVPYEEIMGWFCQRFGFGEIDLAYSLKQATGIPVANIFALRRSGLGWGEIKRQVYLLPTTTVTPTLTTTMTDTPTPDGTPTPQDDQYCTGANPHPTGQKLALRYGVSYGEIMDWFCQGYGFGEIDLAYSLSLETGTPVVEIFGMRQMGYGWGQIKALLNPKPVKPTKKPKNP